MWKEVTVSVCQWECTLVTTCRSYNMPPFCAVILFRAVVLTIWTNPAPPCVTEPCRRHRCPGRPALGAVGWVGGGIPACSDLAHWTSSHCHQGFFGCCSHLHYCHGKLHRGLVPCTVPQTPVYRYMTLEVLFILLAPDLVLSASHSLAIIK